MTFRRIFRAQIMYTSSMIPVQVNIPDHFEPPVRETRASVPEQESHPLEVYSTVLLTQVSVAYDIPAMRQTGPFGLFAEARSLSYATHVKSLSRHKSLALNLR